MDDTLDFNDLENLTDQLLLLSTAENNVPQYILSGSGLGWFWCPQTKQMRMAHRGTEIILISDYSETHSLVLSHDSMLVVDKSEVIEVGYN